MDWNYHVGMFLIKYPLIWLSDKKLSVMDWLTETAHVGDIGLASFYSAGKFTNHLESMKTVLQEVHAMVEESAWNPFAYTYVGVALTPSMFAIGWFMKTRVAFLVNLGTLVGWFFLVPLAVFNHFPVYDATMQANVPIQSYASEGGQALQMIAFSKTVRTIAIGSIVGGGMFGLAKMWRTFANIFKDIGAAFKRGRI